MNNTVPIVLGAFLFILGIMNISGNISSIHWYNRTRITEENRREYGRVVGTGTLVIGVFFIVSGLLSLIFNNELFMLIIILGCIVGLIFILYGQFKYNKGIF